MGASDNSMDKQHILGEIGRTAEANGGVPLGRQRFLAETGIRVSDWSGRFWITWSDAVREAGYEPNAKQAAFKDDWLLERLARLARELGHYPVMPELRMKAREDPEFPATARSPDSGEKRNLPQRLPVGVNRILAGRTYKLSALLSPSLRKSMRRLRRNARRRRSVTSTC